LGVLTELFPKVPTNPSDDLDNIIPLFFVHNEIEKGKANLVVQRWLFVERQTKLQVVCLEM